MDRCFFLELTVFVLSQSLSHGSASADSSNMLEHQSR